MLVTSVRFEEENERHFTQRMRIAFYKLFSLHRLLYSAFHCTNIAIGLILQRSIFLIIQWEKIPKISYQVQNK